jgi:hypothetical protein
MQNVPELNAQHVAGATLFANRADALAALPQGGKIAEIGVAFGDFSQVLLEKLAPRRFDAYDIFRLHEIETIWGRPSADVFRGKSHRAYYEDRFHQQIASGQLRVFEGDSSAEMAQRDDGGYDVIYIDGDHLYDGVLRDAEIAARKIRHDGFLVFNDYTMADHLTMSPYGIVPVVNEFCVNRGWKVIYLALNSQMFCDVCITRCDTVPARHHHFVTSALSLLRHRLRHCWTIFTGKGDRSRLREPQKAASCPPQSEKTESEGPNRKPRTMVETRAIEILRSC